MTPDQANQERREASIRRAHRIDALEAGQLVNFIHRLAAIVPGDVDRVLGEFDANAPKPRTTPKLHPVRLYGGDISRPQGSGVWLYCDIDLGWHTYLEDGHTLEDLEARVREHSGIEP